MQNMQRKQFREKLLMLQQNWQCENFVYEFLSMFIFINEKGNASERIIKIRWHTSTRGDN